MVQATGMDSGTPQEAPQVNWSPSRIAECRKALEEMERQFQRKECAEAARSAAFLKAMATQAEHFIRLEAGVKKRPLSNDPKEVPE